MFDYIRKHIKIMQWVLFLVIVPSFVLVGLDGYTRNNDKGAVVAKVDGRDILQSEWDLAHRNEVERMRSTMPSMDPKMMDSPEARYATLERLVRDRVLAAAADHKQLVTSDQRLAQDLRSNETIASLRLPDGSLDMDRYRQLVGAQGMTPEMFENEVRTDLSRRQVVAGVIGSGVSTNAVASVSLNALFERREVQVQRFSTADYFSKIKLTDADIDAYYQANPAKFQAPEMASIEYLVLDVDALRKGITISDEDVASYYEQNAKSLGSKEERRASHILLNAPKSAPAADRQKTLDKARELLAAVRKAPGSFAEVARKNSQDPGSAASGGDLDFFARGAMVKPFEDVAFSLKKGEISDVVETEYGYHIIQVTDVRAPKQRSLAEMKDELIDDLKKQQAQKLFADRAEAFSNGVYEQSDNLKSTADRLKLEVRTATGVTRTPAPGAQGVLANAKFLTALFSPDSVEKKRNTEAVEVASNQLVSGRIVKYTPAQTRPLAEVKDLARELLLQQRGADMARKEGAEKLAALKAAPNGAALPTSVMLSRDFTQNLPRAVVDAALRADANALPALLGVDLESQGYAVLKVNKVFERGAVDAATAKQELDQYGQWWTAAEGLAYYNLLKDQYKTQIKVPKPAPKSAAASEIVQ